MVHQFDTEERAELVEVIAGWKHDAVRCQLCAVVGLPHLVLEHVGNCLRQSH